MECGGTFPGLLLTPLIHVLRDSPNSNRDGISLRVVDFPHPIDREDVFVVVYEYFKHA